MDFDKFETRVPAVQNAVDTFKGKWASDIGEVVPGVVSGASPLFQGDPRPRLAGGALGNADGRFDGMSILELGPLEGAHSYQLQRLGAKSVLAIEANAEAFLKCLIIKEVTGLDRVRFMLGDFSAYLASAPPRFDIVFCCGVLYHMPDPANLIWLISQATDRCFAWTHYYSDQLSEPNRVPKTVERLGQSVTYYEAEYQDRGSGTFWGGNQPTACWMRKEEILRLFTACGLTNINVLREDPVTPNGPAITFAAAR